MEQDPLSKRLFVTVLALILGLHLVLVLVACPPSVLLGDTPFGSPDFQTHYQQTNTLLEAVAEHGRFWAWDPNMLAGFPAGLFFDVDNKAHFLFTAGLMKLGVSQPVAYNLFGFLTILLAPLSVLLTAWLLGLGRRALLVSLGLAVLLWHFDSGPRFAWSVGMISYAAVAHTTLPVIALFHRFIQGGRPRFFLALLLLLPLQMLIHVWAFAILVGPLVGLYLHRIRSLSKVRHLQVWALAVAAILVNAYWLWPALNHLAILSPSARLGQATPIYFLSDYLGIVLNPLHTGFIMHHTFFRYLALAGAVLTLLAWRRGGDPRLFVGVLTTAWLWGISYLGGWIPGLEHTEPYRFIAAALLSSAVLAGPWLASALSLTSLRALPRAARTLGMVLLILVLPRPLEDINYFLPELTAPFRGLANSGAPATTPAKPAPAALDAADAPYRLASVPPDWRLVASFLDKQCPDPGRVLTQEWFMGEYLRWATDKPILGGFPDRRTIHESSYLFRKDDDARLATRRALADYLVRYNVRYIVMSGRYLASVENRKELLTPVKMIRHHRIYRVSHLGNYLVSGQGEVSAGLNRVTVASATPHRDTQEMILRFHYLSTLRCRPGCRLEQVPLSDSEASFIKVVGDPKLPSKFEIYNGY